MQRVRMLLCLKPRVPVGTVRASMATGLSRNSIEATKRLLGLKPSDRSPHDEHGKSTQDAAVRRSFSTGGTQQYPTPTFDPNGSNPRQPKHSNVTQSTSQFQQQRQESQNLNASNAVPPPNQQQQQHPSWGNMPQPPPTPSWGYNEPPAQPPSSYYPPPAQQQQQQSSYYPPPAQQEQSWYYPPPSQQPAPFYPAPAQQQASYYPPQQGLPYPPPEQQPSSFYPPPSQQPSSFYPPPPPSQQPSTFYPPSSEPPSSFYPSPGQQPGSFYPATIQQPSPIYPPPTQQPSSFYPPPEQQPSCYFQPPSQPPSSYYQPPDQQQYPPTWDYQQPAQPPQPAQQPHPPPRQQKKLKKQPRPRKQQQKLQQQQSESTEAADRVAQMSNFKSPSSSSIPSGRQQPRQPQPQQPKQQQRQQQQRQPQQAPQQSAQQPRPQAGDSAADRVAQMFGSSPTPSATGQQPRQQQHQQQQQSRQKQQQQQRQPQKSPQPSVQQSRPQTGDSASDRVAQMFNVGSSASSSTPSPPPPQQEQSGTFSVAERLARMFNVTISPSSPAESPAPQPQKQKQKKKKQQKPQAKSRTEKAASDTRETVTRSKSSAASPSAPLQQPPPQQQQQQQQQQQGKVQMPAMDENKSAADRLAWMLNASSASNSSSSSSQAPAKDSQPELPASSRRKQDDLDDFFRRIAKQKAASKMSLRQQRRRPSYHDRGRFYRPTRRVQVAKRARKKSIILSDTDKFCIRDASEKFGVPMDRLRRALWELGENTKKYSNTDEFIGAEALQLVSQELGASFEVEIRTSTLSSTEKQEKLQLQHASGDLDDTVGVDSSVDAPIRAPVISVVGHVDHGKTTLLDALRKCKAATREFGDITQGVGAFSVVLNDTEEKDADPVMGTFLDTPGHAAFSEMRSSACKITDVVVLVVALDSGVQEQTLESIRAIRAENLPVVVALTKCDLPGADADAVRNQLLEQGVVDEALGGDVQMVEISAKTGNGLDDLREAIELASEMVVVNVPVDVPAMAAVIESEMHKMKGAILHALVRRGTLKVGDFVVVDESCGRVRALLDQHGKQVKEAKPSQPVSILGVRGSDLPPVGKRLIVVESEARGKEIVEERIHSRKQLELAVSKTWVDESANAKDKEGVANTADKPQTVRLILKSDVLGSLNAVSTFVSNIPQDKGVLVQILSSGAGALTEADVELAKSADAAIFAFNTSIPKKLQKTADSLGVSIHSHRLIYKLMDEIVVHVNKAMPFELLNEVTSRAEVATTFELHGSRGKVTATAAGCRVLSGTLERSARFRVTRGNPKTVVWEGSATSLRHFKEDVPRIEKGQECGVVLDGFGEFVQGDVIECVREVKNQDQFILNGVSVQVERRKRS